MSKTIELFCGTKSFSKVAQEKGYSTFTIDNNIKFNPDICIDILDLDINRIDDDNFMLWASPPCTAFSVCTISKNWKDGKPISKNAELGIKLLEKTIQIISIKKPKYWYIENPRGMMRIIIEPLLKKYNIRPYKRVTVTYCQYGDSRQKPTDIWTNDIFWYPKKCCKPKDKCHISAPRGSRTGTQGLKNAEERSVIPRKLFEEIFVKQN